MIFTSLSPNTQKDDFKLALRLLFKPSLYLKGPYLLKVISWFEDFFSVKYVTLYESARTSLFFILKELGIKKGDNVIIQAFTCVAAVNPIKWAEATPVFVDINPETFNADVDELLNKVNGKTKAIIVQHTFGYPAEIEKIVGFAKSKGIFVIEDCTHTIGTEFSGKKLGTFGDAAIFSFGRDKAISGSFGGVAVINNEQLGRRLKAGQEFLHFPSKKWVLRQILYTVIAYLTRIYYQILGTGKLLHALFSKSGIILKATSRAEKEIGAIPEYAKSKLPNALAHIAYHQLEKLGKINESRRSLYHLYKKHLLKIHSEAITLPSWGETLHFYPLRLPLRVKRRDELLEFAGKQGVLLGDWYSVPVAPKEVDLIEAGYKWGSCPNAEKVCEKVVNLPLHVNMGEEEVLKIVSIIKQFYDIN